MAIQGFRLDNKLRKRYRVSFKKVANEIYSDEKDQTSQMILQFLHKGDTEKMTCVSVDKTQYITLSLELKFHQTVLALFNQCNELKS